MYKEQEEEDAGNESDTLEELEFRENIERHSTLTRTVIFKDVCLAAFVTEEKMLKHIDEEHILVPFVNPHS